MASRWIFAVLLMLMGSVPAYAQDQCGDILQNGVFDKVDIYSRSEYREIIVSRFLSSTYDTSKSSSSGIGGKSIGEMVMGNAYTQADYDLKKQKLSQSYDYSLSNTDEWSLAVRTANTNIVKAWENCAAAASGLRARFETKAGDGKNITLVLEFKGALGVYDATLDYDTLIPGDAKILSQSQYDKCLKAGAVIKDGLPCRVALEMPASKTLKLIISTNRGDVDPYLSKRLKWVQFEKPFSVERHEKFNGGIVTKSGLISISAEDSASGFSFRPGSIFVEGPDQITPRTDGWCRDFDKNVNLTTITYSLKIRGTDNKTSDCKFIMTAVLERGEFLPDE